jgi:ATP-dependent RNA helicase DeaD
VEETSTGPATPAEPQQPVSVEPQPADEGAPKASDYVAQKSFDDLNLSEPVRRAIAERGYLSPTPVQAATLGPIVAGKDVIVRSKTGTGKTAAFGIPMLERIPSGRRKPSAIVLCPTRELALQVAQEIESLAKYKDLSVVAIYGGASMGDQLDKLRAGAEIVVGTPGRVTDHIKRGTLKLDDMMVCCLDEADEMLNMGFFEDVTWILGKLPDGVQQLLFSATVPADIEHIISRYLTEPEAILLSGDEYRVDNIKNVFFHSVDDYPKPRNLLYMIESEEPDSAIVFCNTRNDTSLVAAVLNRNGYDAEVLNGDLQQKERERVMAKVKRGELRFMVATDIAARGIDISDLTHVINYSLPEDPAVYLHRVGRTGRIGKSGTALSLVGGAEMMTLKALQTKYEIQFEERKLPAPEEAKQRWTDRHVAELKEGMSTSLFEGFISLAQELAKRPDGEWLTAFALKYFFTHHRMEKALERAKAEHKREEHVKKEQHHPDEKRVAVPARDEGHAPRADGERRGRRSPRGREERGGRAETSERRGEGGERRERRDRPERTAQPRADAVKTPSVEVDATVPSVEVDATVSAERREPAREQQPARGRVYVTLGQKDGADEAKVRAAVTTLAPQIELLSVDVRPSASFLEVSPEQLDAAVAALNGKELDGKALTAEKARKRRR